MCTTASKILLQLFIVTMSLGLVANGLRLEKVSVPQYGVLDGTVSLLCNFKLGMDTLLSVKWYKDGHEFFRFTPITPISPILTFQAEGVNVDISKSGRNQVVLKNISLETSGNYKCEVSGERPTFRTLSDQGDMIVIAPPKSDPRITGLPSSRKVRIGDIVSCNCTSSKSKPAASLMFYINNEKADSEDMKEYIPVLADPNEALEISSLGLNFQVRSTHFVDGVLELKCSASIGNSYRLTIETLGEAKVGTNTFDFSTKKGSFISGGVYQCHGNKFALIIVTVLTTRLANFFKV